MTDETQEFAALKLRVTSVTVSDGTVLNAPDSGVVLFVGPNNVGKSQALRDIIGHARPNRPYLGKVLPAVTFEKHGSREDAFKWAKQNYPSVARDGVNRILVPGWGEVRPEDFAQQWSNSQPDALADAFILHADGTTRLTAGNAQPNIDFRTQLPTSPIQRAFRSPRLEREISTVSETAFGEAIVVDRFEGSMISLRVGKRPEFEHIDGAPTDEYLQALAGMPTLEEQGDGLKSFMGLMIQLIAGRHEVLLIDEPEAFLHPPQARLLGRLLAQKSVEQQVFIATHSSDVVQGALEGSSNVTIVRLTRDGSVNLAAVLSHDALRELWSDPLLRYSDVLTGLFHDAVVLCEGDADCRYYSAVREHLFPDSADARRRALLFTHCGGKSRMATVVNALRAVRVPVIVIADFDILREAQDVQRLADALGADWAALAPLRTQLDAALTSDTRPLRKTATRDALDTAFESMPEVLSPRDVESLRAVLKADNGWDRVKRAGISTTPQGDATAAAQRLTDDLRKVGLFVVPVGELERFAPSVGGHGPGWVNDVLSQHLHESPAEPAASFVSAIEAYANQL